MEENKEFPQFIEPDDEFIPPTEEFDPSVNDLPEEVILDPVYEAINPRTSDINEYIDMEYRHPTLGLIPYTSSPEGDEVSQILYAKAKSGDFGRVAIIKASIIKEVPQQVSKVQGDLALLEMGLLDDVEKILANPDVDRTLVIAFNGMQYYDRQSPNLAKMTSLLGLTDEQVDDLFILASKIEI